MGSGAEQKQITIVVDQPVETWQEKVVDHAIEAGAAIFIGLVVTYLSHRWWRHKHPKKTKE